MLLLPPRFQKAVAFFYVKNNTLFGGLSHPGYKMELNYNKDLVKTLLKQLVSIEQSCKEVFADVGDVEFFVSKYHAPAPLAVQKSDVKYKELATGNFVLHVSDSEIKDIFEKIKEDIVRNNETR